MVLYEDNKAKYDAVSKDLFLSLIHILAQLPDGFQGSAEGQGLSGADDGVSCKYHGDVYKRQL